jgi:hypothetical protein
MCTWHVLRDGGVAMLDQRACMAGDAYAAMEHLDDLLCDTHVDDLADQTRGHGVEMPAHLDVIIGSDAGAAPLRVLIGLGRQRQQRRSINALEELAAAFLVRGKFIAHGGTLLAVVTC